MLNRGRPTERECPLRAAVRAWLERLFADMAWYG